LLGLWLGARIVLQPIAAVYALRGTRCRSWEAELVAILSICVPALLLRLRLGHINLCGHFVLLFALGIALGKVAAGRGTAGYDWIGPCTLLTLAVLVHSYLFVFVGRCSQGLPSSPCWHAGMAGHDSCFGIRRH
jgi:hypothetical protein